MAHFPARIHVLFASHAPLGLVIRRGPSKHVATLLWDRRRDDFELGQWLKGRIYERRSDLSPDGKHFIYFAMDGKWASEAKGAWTAISRAPYLKALAIFPKGDCWHGGGLWTNKNSKGCYWDEHQLVREASGTEIDCLDWEWAELDDQRLVWASGGKLFSGTVKSDGLADETELFDFNPLAFEPIQAPY